LVARLPLPRPVALGTASAFASPSASLATGAVIAFGLTAAVLAIGLNSQMQQLVVGATTPQNGAVLAGQALVRRLTVLVAVVATLGVLSAVIMLARQRLHDLGVYKAIGATPPQIIVTIVSWVLAPAIVAALIAVPAGIVMEHEVARVTVNAQVAPLARGVRRAGFGVPATHIGLAPSYNPGTLALVVLAGLAVAVAGALGPATWAAFSRTTAALRAE
jgi:putative ABC transport system permease protein